MQLKPIIFLYPTNYTFFYPTCVLEDGNRVRVVVKGGEKQEDKRNPV